MSAPSRILLLCLRIEKGFKSSDTVPVSFLKDLFEPFGALRKIIVFSHKRILKAFVEFENTDSAIAARDTCDNCLLEHLGLLRLFFSDKAAIEPKEGPFQVLVLEEAKPLLGPQSAFQQKQRFPKRENTRFDCVVGPGAVDVHSGPSTVDQQILKATADLRPPPASTEPSYPLKSPSDCFQNNKVNFTKPKPSWASLPQEPDPFDPNYIELPSLRQHSQPLPVPSMFKNNHVLLASNLDGFWTEPECLIGFFSCFGNLTRMLLLTKTKKALIEFFNSADMHSAVLNTTDDCFAEANVKVNFSKYKKLNVDGPFEKKESDTVVVEIQKAWSRYSDKSKVRRPPSKALLFESQASLNGLPFFHKLQELVSEGVIPSSSKALPSSRSSKSRLIFEYQTVSQAVRILSRTHMRKFQNSELRVSFWNGGF